MAAPRTRSRLCTRTRGSRSGNFPKGRLCANDQRALTFTRGSWYYDVGRSEGIVLRYLTDVRAARQVCQTKLMTDELRLVCLIARADPARSTPRLLEAMSTGRAYTSGGDGGGVRNWRLARGGWGQFPSARASLFHGDGALFERVEAMSAMASRSPWRAWTRLRAPR